MADSFIPKIALDYIKNKRLKTGFSYKDVWNEEHATCFTVAKAMQIDVLADFKKAVEKAIEKGETFEQFKKNIKPTLIQKGWWGKKDMVDPLTGETVNAQLGSDRRLKTIYDTNIRSAYSKGSYDRAMESVFVKYFIYRIGYSQRHRAEHVAWDGLVLPKEHPFWAMHYPPREHGCHCFAPSLTEEKKQRFEKEGFPTPRMQDGSGGVNMPIKTVAPKEEYVIYENLRKGTVERIPKGVAPGFAWNPGDPRSSQTMRACMDKIQQKFPGKVDDLARYFANEKVTKGILREDSDKKDKLIRKLSEVIDAKPSQLEIEDFLAATPNYRNMNKTQKQAAMQKWLVEIGKKEGVERVAVLNGRTGDVLAMNRGFSDNVKLGGEIWRVLSSAKKKSMDLYHNHPLNTTFSLEDICTANLYGAIRTLYVYCHDGKVYSLSVPKGKELIEEKIKSEYNTIRPEVRDIVAEQAKQVDDIENEIKHKTVELLAKKFRWVYKRIK